MRIPKKMSNEESKLVAAVILAEREMALAKANLVASKNILRTFRKAVK